MLRKEDNELLTRTDPGTPMGEFLRRYWLPILKSEELPAPDCAPVRVKIMGEELVAFRDTQGRLGLVQEHCAHRRTSLFYGRNEESGLRCTYHGWKYDVNGVCVDMPNEPPEYDFKERVRLTAYPCVERGTAIWAYMGPREHGAPPFPEYDWVSLPESHQYMVKYHHACNWLQVMEGVIDDAHASFLHSDLHSEAVKGARAADFALFRQQKHTLPVVQETDYGLAVTNQRKLPDGGNYWRVTRVFWPAHMQVRARPYRNFNMAVPIDDENCWSFRLQWHGERPLSARELHNARGFGDGSQPELIPGTYRLRRDAHNDFMLDRLAQQKYSFTGIQGVIEQDVAATLSMGKVVDRTKEHLGHSDMAVSALRRMLIRGVRAFEKGEQPPTVREPAVFRGIRAANVVIKEDLSMTEFLQRLDRKELDEFAGA